MVVRTKRGSGFRPKRTVKYHYYGEAVICIAIVKEAGPVEFRSAQQKHYHDGKGVLVILRQNAGPVQAEAHSQLPLLWQSGYMDSSRKRSGTGRIPKRTVKHYHDGVVYIAPSVCQHRSQTQIKRRSKTQIKNAVLT